MGIRMLLVDPPPGTELDQGGKVSDLQPPSSTYSLLYYPWVKVKNPLYNQVTNATAPTTITPCPIGLCRRHLGPDRRHPRGVEGAGRRRSLGQRGGGLGVCVWKTAIRISSTRWGSTACARCPVMATWSGEPVPWPPSPTRSGAMSRSGGPRSTSRAVIRNGIQWAVFEPNDHRLWSSLPRQYWRLHGRHVPRRCLPGPEGLGRLLCPLRPGRHHDPG